MLNWNERFYLEQVNYPGLSTGGTMWFTDLTIADPYYILPLISAGTMAVVSRLICFVLLIPRGNVNTDSELESKWANLLIQCLLQ